MQPPGPRALLLPSITAAALALLAPSSAEAQAASRAEMKLAKEMAVEAEEAEKAGRCEEAIDILTQVVAIHETAAVHMRIGDCQAKTGKLLEARASYEQAEAVAKAKKDKATLKALPAKLEDVRARIPKLEIKLAEDARGATLKLDGNEIGADAGAVDVDPGEHTIDASLGERTVSKTVIVAEKETVPVEVSFPPVGAAPDDDLGPAPEPKPDAPEGKGAPLGTWIAGGAALVLAAGGVVSFVVAGSAASEGEAQCRTQPSCDPAAVSKVQTLDAAALGLWIAATASAGVAITLYALHEPTPSGSSARSLPSGPRSPRAGQARATGRAVPRPRASAELRLVPGWISVGGSF